MRAQISDEGGLLFVAKVHPYLVVSRIGVGKGEECVSCYNIHKEVYSW